MKKAGTTIGDYGLIEANEAFSVQALADGAASGWDWDRVNVNGGAVALGHPIGASGARVLTTLLYAMRDRKVATGLATLCLAAATPSRSRWRRSEATGRLARSACRRRSWCPVSWWRRGSTASPPPRSGAAPRRPSRRRRCSSRRRASRPSGWPPGSSDFVPRGSRPWTCGGHRGGAGASSSGLAIGIVPAVLAMVVAVRRPGRVGARWRDRRPPGSHGWPVTTGPAPPGGLRRGTDLPRRPAGGLSARPSAAAPRSWSLSAVVRTGPPLQPGITPLAVGNIALAGVFLGIAFYLPGGLWTATGAHLGWNATLAALAAPVSGLPFAMPWLDYRSGGPAWLSGGGFGPEGGLLGTAALVLATVGVWRRFSAPASR